MAKMSKVSLRLSYASHSVGKVKNHAWLPGTSTVYCTPLGTYCKLSNWSQALLRSLSMLRWTLDRHDRLQGLGKFDGHDIETFHCCF